jgi:hypothetical protein
VTTTKARKSHADEPKERDPLRDMELPAEAIADAQTVPARHVPRRSDADVPIFGFCRIETGDHAGEIGSFQSVVSEDDEGYPEVVMVQLRNSNTTVVVDYADLTPAAFGGR